jgi:hypothetical protein
MSETKKERGPKASYKTDDKGNLFRRLGGSDEPIDLSPMSLETERKAIREAAVVYLSRGCALADIISGAAFPDRSLRATRSNGASSTKLGNAKLQAIAQVYAKHLLKTQRMDGQKGRDSAEAVAAANEAGAAFANGLTPDAVAVWMKNKQVKIAHAEITSDDTPIDDLLASAPPSAPTADAELENAAN